MAVGTNVRAGRTWRTLVAAQSAKGTPVDALSGATQTWCTRAGSDTATEQSQPEWWMSFKNDYKNARYGLATLGRDSIVAHATPALTSLALQSLFGTLTGSTFALTGYVAKWLTLGFVEDKTRTNTATSLVRAHDAMIHAIVFDVDSNGYADITCDYAAEGGDNTTLSDLGVITLPSAPMDTTDKDVFPGRSVTLHRDPTGANVRIPFERLTISLSVNLGQEWDMLGQKERAKKWGPITTKIVAQGKASDEYWQMILDGEDDTTKKTYRVTLPGPNNHTLTMTFYNVSFNVAPLTMQDKTYESVVATGMATQDLSDNFVSITLT